MERNGIDAGAFAKQSLWQKYTGVPHDTLGKELTWFFAQYGGVKVNTTLLRCMYTTESYQAAEEGFISPRELRAIHNINGHSPKMAQKAYRIQSRAADIVHGRTVSSCLLGRGRLSEDASEDERPYKRVSRGHDGRRHRSPQLDGQEDDSPFAGLSGRRDLGLSRWSRFDNVPSVEVHTGEMDDVDDDADGDWYGDWDGNGDGHGDGGDLDSGSDHDRGGSSSSASPHRPLFQASWGSTRPAPAMSSAGSLHPTEVGAKRQRWSPFEVRYVGEFCENVIKTNPARQTTMISECLKSIRSDPETLPHFHPKHIEKSNSLKTGWVRYSTLKVNGELDAFLS